jgi:DNA replication protein DnaC
VILTFTDSDGVEKPVYREIDVDGETVVEYTLEWKRYQSIGRIEERLRAAGVPPHVSTLSISDMSVPEGVRPKLQKYVDNFKTHYYNRNLYFWSTKNATQKTTTASIIAKELILQGLSVSFILFSDLATTLMKENFHEEVADSVQRLLKSDLLILDDAFDPSKVTLYKSGYQIPLLDSFLRERLEQHQKATIFTANVSPTGIIEDKFGKSLCNLIQRSVVGLEFRIVRRTSVTASWWEDM